MSERDEMRMEQMAEDPAQLDRALERALDPAEVTEIMRLDAALGAFDAGHEPEIDASEDPELTAIFVTARSIDRAFGATTGTRSFQSFHQRSRAAVLHQLEAERPIPFRERLRVVVAAAAGIAAVTLSIATYGGSALDGIRGDSGNGANVTVANLTPLSTQDQLDRLGLAVDGIRSTSLAGESLSSAQLHSFTENAAQMANAIESQADGLSADAVRAYIERAEAAREALSTGQAEPGAEGAVAAAQRAAEDGIVVASRFLGEGVTQGSDTPAPTETPDAPTTPTDDETEGPALPVDGDDGDTDGDETPDGEATATPTATPTASPSPTPTATPSSTPPATPTAR